MRRLAVELGALAAIAAGLLLCWLGAGGLWDPAEAALVESLWRGDVTATRPLDALATSAGITLGGSSPFTARLGHAVFGIAAALAVWTVTPGARRVRVYAVVALLASPAVFLAARSAAGGVVVIMPVALSSWGFIDHLQAGRRWSLGVGAVGALLAMTAAGITTCVVPLVAVLALLATTPSLRTHALHALAALAITAIAGVVLARALDVPLVPGGLPKTLAFDTGLGRLGLGLFPLVLALPVAFALGAFEQPERRCWLAFAAAWCVPVMLWPGDPWIALAPAAALAVLAGMAFDDLAHAAAAPALAIVLALGTFVIARSIHLDPALLVAAHVDGGVEAAGPGKLGWLLFAVLALALACAALRRDPRAVAVALGAAALITLRGAHLGARSSASLEAFVTLTRAHALPLEIGLGTRGHALAFAGAPGVRELATVDELAQQLAAPGCRAGLIAHPELAALHRQTRGRMFLLGEARAQMHLATNCLPEGARDTNAFTNVLVATLPALGRPVDGAWDGAVRIRAIEVADRIDDRAKELPVTLVFEVLAQLPARHGVMLALEGCDDQLTGHHRLVDGLLASDALRPGDIIIDRAKIPLDKPKPCAYALRVGWASRRTLLRATRGGGDESERVTLGTVTVVAAPP